MGEQRRWVVSVDEETHRLAEQWQADFSPLVGSNRSSLVRLVFKTLDRLGFTAATLTAALAQPQRIKVETSEQPVTTLNNLSQEEFSVVPNAQKKPLVRVGSPRQGSHQRQEFSCVSSRVVLASVAYITSRIHSTRVSRWAA